MNVSKYKYITQTEQTFFTSFFCSPVAVASASKEEKRCSSHSQVECLVRDVREFAFTYIQPFHVEHRLNIKISFHCIILFTYFD